MKEFDRVELIKDREEYKKRGITIGAQGHVAMAEVRNGYVLVFFDGDLYQSKYGVELMHEIDVGVRVEDLKVVKPFEEKTDS